MNRQPDVEYGLIISMRRELSQKIMAAAPLLRQFTYNELDIFPFIFPADSKPANAVMFDDRRRMVGSLTTLAYFLDKLAQRGALNSAITPDSVPTLGKAAQLTAEEYQHLVTLFTPPH